MKKQQKEIANIIQGLLDRDDVKGKKALRDVLWLNTVETKYRIGDFINASDYGLRIGGDRVVRWNMRVAKIIYHTPWSRDYHYECICQVVNNGKSNEHTIHVSEGKLSDMTEEIEVYI